MTLRQTVKIEEKQKNYITRKLYVYYTNMKRELGDGLLECSFEQSNNFSNSRKGGELTNGDSVHRGLTKGLYNSEGEKANTVVCSFSHPSCRSAV